jgi:succinate-acetate transporter protein
MCHPNTTYAQCHYFAQNECSLKGLNNNVHDALVVTTVHGTRKPAFGIFEFSAADTFAASAIKAFGSLFLYFTSNTLVFSAVFVSRNNKSVK